MQWMSIAPHFLIDSDTPKRFHEIIAPREQLCPRIDQGIDSQNRIFLILRMLCSSSSSRKYKLALSFKISTTSFLSRLIVTVASLESSTAWRDRAEQASIRTDEEDETKSLYLAK